MENPDKRETFIAYKDWWVELLKEMPDDMRLKIYDSIFQFAFENKTPEDATVKMVCSLIFSRIRRDRKNFKEAVEKKSKAGKASGEARRRARDARQGTASDDDEEEDDEQNEHVFVLLNGVESVEPNVHVHVNESNSLLEKERELDEKIKNKKNSVAVGLNQTATEEKENESGREIPTLGKVRDFFAATGRSEESAKAFFAYNTRRGWRIPEDKTWVDLAERWRDPVANPPATAAQSPQAESPQESKDPLDYIPKMPDDPATCDGIPITVARFRDMVTVAMAGTMTIEYEKTDGTVVSMEGTVKALLDKYGTDTILYKVSKMGEKGDWDGAYRWCAQKDRMADYMISEGIQRAKENFLEIRKNYVAEQRERIRRQEAVPEF